MDTLTALNKFREHVAMFVPLDDAEWQVLMPHLEISTLKKNFTEPDKICNHIALVVKG
jgi:hypothetical protein